jgi:hypothetical protein
MMGIIARLFAREVAVRAGPADARAAALHAASFIADGAHELIACSQIVTSLPIAPREPLSPDSSCHGS